jgi:hypothetical protein
MLAEKIARARQAKRRSTLRLLILSSVAVLVAAMLLYASSHSLWPETTAPSASDNAEVVGSSDLTTVPSETPATDEEARQRYIEAYAHYQNQLKPQLEQIDIKRWDEVLADRLQQDEAAAIEAFSAGDYAKAERAMKALNMLAETTIENSRQAFTEAMQQAQQAYDALDYNRARLEIDRALTHRAGDEAAQQLSEKIELIPQLASLEKAIAVARAENNPSEELRLINKLLQIDSEREVMQQRAASLQSQLAANRYDQHIAQGYNAIDSQDLSTAKAQLNQARQLYPDRTENQQLAAAITELESQLVYESSVAAAQEAQQADNWQTAVTEWKQALQQRPADKAISDNLARAERIVSLQQQMQALLANPYRLSNDLVKSKADIALIQAESVREASPSLNAIAKKLRDSINAVNKAVTVEVISDGKTDISVRGVGVVGTTRSKKIELKPGTYQFEGKRQGYKSKIIEVNIPLDSASYQVSIIADERI